MGDGAVSLNEIVDLVRDIASILALLLGAYVGIFHFLRFYPVVVVRILPSWPVVGSRWVVLRLEIENRSRVRVRKEKVLLQVLEHRVHEGEHLSEWVPFEEGAVIPSEKPVRWNEPVEVFESTTGLGPGEVVAIERLYYCPPGSVLHVGLQFRAQLGVLAKIGGRMRGWRNQWTATKIVMRG